MILLERPQLGLNSVPSTRNATALLLGLNEISTRSQSKEYLTLWYLNGQANVLTRYTPIM